MTNKNLFSLASLSLIIGITASILNRQGISLLKEHYITYAYRLAIVMFLFIQLANGSFKDKGRNRKVLQGFIAIFIVAILFKILHWEGTQLLLGISMIGTAVFYSLHFFSKHEKDYRDYLKLAFSWTFMLGFWLSLGYRIYSIELLWSSYLLLAILSFDFAFNDIFKKKTP